MTTNLVLGGHSFIPQLGTDPVPDRALAADIVAACLDAGIVHFDTTYAPERVALGRALEDLGRRDEAFVFAWNFFDHFGPEDPPSAPAAFRADSLGRVLDELRSDRIDLLVVHPVPDPVEQRDQEELAAEWLAQGRVGALGTWMPEPDAIGAATFVGAPYNVADRAAAPLFAAARHRGLTTFATSPFVRGWELDRRVHAGGGSLAEVADLLLRFAAFAPDVDLLVVSMRRPERVASNLASLARGPLDPDTLRQLLAAE
jgi:aryl-alcohol dehydrogenase-like predicted oxidoreductase